MPLSRFDPLIPVYVGAWSGRPAANAVDTGARMVVTDVGNGHSDWVSTGTVWRPAGGLQVLFSRNGSLASPVASLTGNGAAQAFTLPANILLPGGMLYAGCRLEIDAFLHKAGTHTGTFICAISTTSSDVSTSTNHIYSGASVAGNPSSNRVANTVAITAGSRHSQLGAGAWSTGGSSTASIDRTDANINTDDRYVVFGIGSTYTDSAASLVSYSVALRG